MDLVCDVCDERFRHRGALSNHRRRHARAQATLAGRRGAEPGGDGPGAVAPVAAGAAGLPEPDRAAGATADDGDARGGRAASRRVASIGDACGDDETNDGRERGRPLSGTESDDDDSDSDDDSYGGSDDDSDDGVERDNCGAATDQPPESDSSGRAALDTSDASRTPELNSAHLRFVSMAQRARLSERQVDAVLAYVRESSFSDLRTLPRHARTLGRRVDAWGSLLASASRRPPVPGDALVAPATFVQRTFVHGDYKLSVHLRDIWAVIAETFLLDAAAAPQLHFGATTPRAADGSRLYSQMWTGSWWSRAEEALPWGTDLLAVILHIDDTPVWNKALGPVYVTLGNLPTAARRVHANLPVLAYLPKLDAPSGVRKTAAFRAAKRALLHLILAEIVRPLDEVRRLGGVGVWVAGRHRHVLPQLALIVADNEEKALLSLAYKKKTSARPCHHCHVPGVRLGDTVGTSLAPFPARRVHEAQEVVQAASGRGRAAAAARRLAKEMSLHSMRNGLWIDGFSVYTSMPPDLLHEADLGVWKRLVTALFDWLERTAPRAADELDQRLHAMTAAPAPAIKRFGASGFRGLQRAEGKHLQSTMALLPLALVDLPGVDVTEVCHLAAEWLDIYMFLQSTEVAGSELAAWQVKAAAWGERLREWLRSVGSADGVFPKLHHLLGGHMRDAIKRYGVPAGFDAGAFEGRHVSSTKAPARLASRSTDLVAQLAKRARRDEYLDTLTHHVDTPAATAARTATAQYGGVAHGSAALSWPGEALDMAKLERTLRIRKLAEITATFLREEAPDDIPAEAGTAAVLTGRLPALHRHRLRLASGALAYAHPAFRGAARYDDVAVSAPGGATWFARLVAPACFVLPSGRTVEAVLVRWYETATTQAGRASTTATARTRLAVASCARVRPGDPGLDWCLPEQLLYRVALVPDWTQPGTFYVNEFLARLLGACGGGADGPSADDDSSDSDRGGGRLAAALAA